MADFIPDLEDIGKYQEYTGYFFIDIKATFIIIYVYISVINLMSTTANNEAMQDTESPVLFNLTSRPEHTNVNVSSIDDATLWSCREYSPTRTYYKFLYSMLLTTFSAILLFYFISKSLALWSITARTNLWYMAVMKQLREHMKDDQLDSYIKAYQGLLSDKIRPNDEKIKSLSQAGVRIIKLMSWISLIGLISAMTFGVLSYDLHLVSCISGIPEDSIGYDNATQTVELRYTESVMNFQKISVFFALLSLFAIILPARIFRQKTAEIVGKMKDEVKDITQRNADAT